MDNTKEKNNSRPFPPKVYRAMNFSLFLMVVSLLLLLLISYLGFLKPELETNESWFQRSGSLVMIIVLVSYNPN